MVRRRWFAVRPVRGAAFVGRYTAPPARSSYIDGATGPYATKADALRAAGYDVPPARPFTAATINARLRAAGERLAVRQGRGYVYVHDVDGGAEACAWFSSSIPVCYVRDLGDTVDEAFDAVMSHVRDQRTR
jgi:hypothetical protein